MNQKCYLCDNDGAKIIERPNGYDGDHVHCLQCANYKITRNAVNKIVQGHQVPASLSEKIRSHFKKTGEPYEISMVTLSLYK